MMRSFFRKKNTIVYIIIMTFMFIALFFLNNILDTLNNEKQNYFMKSTLLYVESSIDYFKYLENNIDIQNIHKCSLVNGNNKIFGNISNEIFIIKELNNAIVCFDSSLDEKDFIINVSDFVLLNNPKVKEFKATNIDYNFNDYTGILNLKDIISINNFSRLIISEKLYNKIASSDVFIYISNIRNESKVEKVLDNLTKNKKNKIAFLENNDEKELLYQKKIRTMLNYLSIANYIIITIFSIIIIIISKNILFDSKWDLSLQYKLGFNKRQIRILLLRKLLMLHSISILLAFILMSILVLLTNTYYKISSLVRVYILFILISDWLLTLVVNIYLRKEVNII